MRQPLQRLSCFLILPALVSCHVQKRVYMPGYYIEWKVAHKMAPTPAPKRFTGYSLSAYNALSTKPSEESLLTVANPEPIHCKEGTEIEFPANAFMYENGKPLRCTQVAVFVTEFYSMSDIVASGLSTSDHGRMLVSAGMVYIDVRCHGEKLKLRPGKQVTIRMPGTEADTRMKAFAGQISEGLVDWKVEGKLKVDGQPEVEDTPVSGDYKNEGYWGESDKETSYLIKMSSLGWINCDRFSEEKTTTKLLVRTDSASKTFVALVFRDIKSVMPGSQFSNRITEFSGIPVGSNATVLAYRINEKQGSALVGIEDVVTGDTAVVQPAMTAMALNDFKSLLKQFD